MKLEITEKAFQHIHDHAEADYPNECCGFMYGQQDDNEHRTVTLAQKVDNSKEGDQRRRFQIDPNDYRKAEEFALEQDLELLGVYHSHPNHPAKPSEHDRKQAFPFFSYVIVSVQDGKTANTNSWRLNDDAQFDEEIIQQKTKSTTQ